MAISRSKVKSYELNGQIYSIPDKSDIDKGVDTTGVLDPWPAFSSQRNIPNKELVMTRNKHLVVLDENSTKLPNLTPKPKFLEYLEDYLHKELKKHNAEEIGSNSVRLDIYREILDWLMEAFKTYKPILAEIKREYEVTIANLKEEIRRLEPLKEMIWTITEEKNREILQIMKRERDDITILKAEKIDLLKQIGQMEADQVTLETQIEKLKDSLEEEHRLRRNESDARKLLIMDINDKRQQLEEIQMIKSTQQGNVSTDDPIVMRIGLEEAKRAHSELLTELTRMKINYSDVVPKREYETLLDKYTALTESSSHATETLAQLEVDHQALEEKYSALQQQRDFYNVKYMELTRTVTPRPDWKKCGEFVSGGPLWWIEHSKEKSSKQLVDLLLQEITQNSSIRQQIEAKGTDVQVLPFLRAEGKVNLRFITKRDVKIHIREIWNNRKVLKDEQLEAISKNQEYILPPMPEYVDLFFKKTYGIEQIRLEWAYSFFDAIEKEKTDMNIRQFYRILNKEMDEDVYWEEIIFFTSLKESIITKDEENKKWITLNDLKVILEEKFVKKPSEEVMNQILQLLDTFEGENEEKRVNYEDIFMMTDEGDYSKFAERIRKLIIEDQDAYIKEIEKELKDVGSSKVTTKQLKECIQIVDPEIPINILNKYVAWCFNTSLTTSSVEQLDNLEPKTIESILFQLHMGSVKRMSLKN